MNHLPSHLRLWIVTALGLFADLWTKDWAFRSLDYQESKVVIENLCNLRLSLNPGALFGFGAGMAPIFVGASVLALLFVLYYFANSGAGRWSVHVALGFVLAGALGNLYDRTTQAAYVVHLSDGRGGSARKDIGILARQTDTHITLADFPGGGNERTWPRPTDSRSGFQPVVRDFVKIDASIGSFSLWPWIFNIADALLVFGVGILLINLWIDRKHHLSAEALQAARSKASAAADRA